MKKISLLSVCLFAGLAASAQMSLVKEVEREVKSGNDFQQALQKIQPALTNPESDKQAQTWYVAGQAAFKGYDKYYVQYTISGDLPAADKVKAGTDMLDGYNYFFTALPLDSMPDAKGKVKPKYSKDMLKTLKENYQQLKQAGVFLWEAQEFNKAYDAWQLYVDLPTNPIMGNSAPVADPDTIVGQIIYYQGVAMLAANQPERALDRMQQAIKRGYENIDVYRYGAESARLLNDSIALHNLAEAGYEKYGTQDVFFVGQLLNGYLNAGEYDKCITLVNEALQAIPADNVDIRSQLYDMLGFICDEQKDFDGAVTNFKESIKLNPSSGKAYFDLGRVLYNHALELDEANTDETQLKTKIVPMFLEAADYFKKAYELDEENQTQVPGILYRLYYRLGPDYETEANKWQNM